MRTIHTPGSWTCQYNPYTSQDGEEIPAFEICGDEKICDTNENRPVAEQEANARLISAAPDMLEALLAQDMADADPEASRRKGYFEYAVELRRVAIAKATGGCQ